MRNPVDINDVISWLEAGAPHVLFDMRVADTKPKYDPLVTAMVIWEAVLDSDISFESLGGACEARDHFATMVPKVEEAFNYASTLGYDAPFDWDFVPWLISILEPDQTMPLDWPVLVWEHCQ